MSLLHFLRQLFDHGRVTVAADDAQQVGERELTLLLQELDAEHSRHLPPGLPPFELPAAIWGAKTLYHAGQVLAYRDLGVESLQQAIRAGNFAATAGEQRSVDLCLRFLPDLIRLARVASLNDPLVNCLLELGGDWPLSSVGISGLTLSERGIARIAGLAREPAVWRCYVNRILQAGDATRLTDSATAMSVRAAVGAFPELAGKLTKELALKKPEEAVTGRSAP